MNQSVKKLLSLILALAMTVSLAALPALAMEESVSEEEAVCDVVEYGKIVGFAPFDTRAHALTLSAQNRPTEQELVKRMPKTLGVELESGESVSIPVEWYCTTNDYAEGRYYHYQFSPKWDGYELAKGIDLSVDAPYISVSFAEELDGLSTLSVCGSKYAKYELLTLQFLMNQMGLNAAQACGIMANIYAECSFKPNNLQGYFNDLYKLTDEEYTKQVDDGTYSFSEKVNGKKKTYAKGRESFMRDHAGYGLVQWTYYTRKAAFYDFVKSKNKSIGDFDTQLQYMKKEIEENYSKTLETIKTYPNTAQGAYDTASKFCEKYEQPGSLQERMKERGNYAKDKYWKEYASMVGADVLPPVTMAPPAEDEMEQLGFGGNFLKEYVFTYDGTAHRPAIEPTMTEAVNYNVVYENNVNVGTGTVKLVSKETGEVLDMAQFDINSRPITKAVPTLANDKVYDKGSPRCVGVTVKDTLNQKTVTLKNGVDYILTYQNNTAVGTATVNIIGIGNYHGFVSKTFKILPKATTPSSASSKKKKKLTVKWKKNTTCTGYQIQVATDKDFTKNLKKKTISKNKTTSYTFSSLKSKKKYYIRMRTYKKVGDVKYYSEWKVYSKKVKTK